MKKVFDTFRFTNQPSATGVMGSAFPMMVTNGIFRVIPETISLREDMEDFESFVEVCIEEDFTIAEFREQAYLTNNNFPIPKDTVMFATIIEAEGDTESVLRIITLEDIVEKVCAIAEESITDGEDDGVCGICVYITPSLYDDEFVHPVSHKVLAELIHSLSNKLTIVPVYKIDGKIPDKVRKALVGLEPFTTNMANVDGCDMTVHNISGNVTLVANLKNEEYTTEGALTIIDAARVMIALI